MISFCMRVPFKCFGLKKRPFGAGCISLVWCPVLLLCKREFVMKDTMEVCIVLVVDFGLGEWRRLGGRRLCQGPDAELEGLQVCGHF